MPESAYDWFADRIRAKKLTQAALARLLGMDPSSLSLLLHGKRRMRVEQAAEIARLLGVPVSDVMAHGGADTRGLKASPDAPQRVPLVGWIDAAEVVTLDWTNRETVFDLEGYFPPTAVCLQWRTAQTPAAFRDGWLAVTLPPREPDPQDMLDRYCVVGLKDGGGAGIKTIRRGYTAGRYTLLSESGQPIHNVELAWWSPILVILPV